MIKIDKSHIDIKGTNLELFTELSLVMHTMIADCEDEEERKFCIDSLQLALNLAKIDADIIENASTPSETISEKDDRFDSILGSLIKGAFECQDNH